jgi:hypothetical protein
MQLFMIQNVWPVIFRLAARQRLPRARLQHVRSASNNAPLVTCQRSNCLERTASSPITGSGSLSLAKRCRIEEEPQINADDTDQNKQDIRGSLVDLLLIRVIRVNLRLIFLCCCYGFAGAAEGVAIIVTRFFQSAGLVE